MGKDKWAEENGGGRSRPCYGIILPSCTIMAEIRPCKALQLACQDQTVLRDSSVSFLLFFSSLSSSSSSRMHVWGSQGNIPEGWGTVHDRVYTSSIFNMVRVHSVGPRRDEETQLASAQNTVRAILSPLGDKTNPMAQSTSTARVILRAEQSTKCHPEPSATLSEQQQSRNMVQKQNCALS